MLNALLNAFTADPTVKVILILIPLDLALGVLAAFKLGTFRLSYVADFLRNDVLGKAIPYFALWAALHVTDWDFTLISGNFDVIEEAAGALAILALSGSLFKSLADLGLGGAPPAKKDQTLGSALAGADPNAKI